MTKKNQKIFLMVFLIASGAGCVEPYRGTDNQIVVIGNGSQWSNTLVLDIAKEDHLESLVLSPNGLHPVAEKLQADVIKNVDASSATNPLTPSITTPTSKPLFLEWVAPTPQQNLILKADHVDQDAQLKEQQVYESGTKGTKRRSDLEDLPFSAKIKPIFLSDGSVLFVDQNDQLFWRDASYHLHWIASDIIDLLSDGYQTFFYRKGNIWFMMGVQEMMSEETTKILRPLFNKGIFYQTGNNSIYVVSLENEARDIFHFKLQMLYKWNIQTKSFAPIWKQNSVIQVIDSDSVSVATGQNAYFALSQTISNFNSFAVDKKILGWSESGLFYLPLKTAALKKELVAGNRVVLALERSNSELSSIEICRKIEPMSNVKINFSQIQWSCEMVNSVPEHLSRAVITDQDEIYILGADALYKLNPEAQTPFTAVSNTQRNDLSNLRFLQVPMNAMARTKEN